MLGAPFSMGIGIRHSQDVSHTAYGSRWQIDFHIFSIQIIDLHSVEPTNMKEIFGKQDISHPKIKSRARVQMVDSDDSGGWVVDGEERPEKDCEDNDPRAWNMHVGMKIQSINVMASAASVARILNCAQALKISLQPPKRTECQPTPSMASQAGSQMSVTAHSTFMQLRWRIDLALSNISIALPLGHQLEGLRLDMGKNLCTTFSVNTCMYEDNDQYGKVSLILNVLDAKFFRPFDNWLILEPTTDSCKVFPIGPLYERNSNKKTR